MIQKYLIYCVSIILLSAGFVIAQDVVGLGSDVNRLGPEVAVPGPSNAVPISFGTDCENLLFVSEVILNRSPISLREDLELLYLNAPLKRDRGLVYFEEENVHILIDFYLYGSPGNFSLDATVYSPSSQPIFSEKLEIRLDERETDLARAITGFALPDRGKDIFTEQGVYRIVVTQGRDKKLSDDCFIGGSTWSIFSN